MPTCNFADTGRQPRTRTRLDPTKAKKKPVSDVIYYEAPNPATKHKAEQPQPTKHILDEDLDGLAKQLAGHTLEPRKAWVTEKRTNADLTGFWAWEKPDKTKPDEKPKEPHTLQPVQQTILPPALRKFTCFGRLPIELRLKIWKHARPNPRIIQLSRSTHLDLPSWQDPNDEKGFDLDFFRPIYSKALIPAVLHASAEARQVALKWYQLAFASSYNPGGPRVYFDSSADYLHVDCENWVVPEGEGSIFWGRCSKCTTFYCKENKTVSKIFLSWPTNAQAPFVDIYLHFRGVKEILIIDPTLELARLKPGIQLTDLKETDKPFKWQKGKTLHAAFLEEKDKFDGWFAESLLDDNWSGKRSLENGPFRPERFARVEQALTWDMFYIDKVGKKRTFEVMENECKRNPIEFDFHPKLM